MAFRRPFRNISTADNTKDLADIVQNVATSGSFPVFLLRQPARCRENSLRSIVILNLKFMNKFWVCYKICWRPANPRILRKEFFRLFDFLIKNELTDLSRIFVISWIMYFCHVLAENYA